jgi:hypothetical protein
VQVGANYHTFETVQLGTQERAALDTAKRRRCQPMWE